MHDIAIIQGILDAIVEEANGKKPKEISLCVGIGALKHVHNDNVKFWLEEMLKKEFGPDLKTKITVKKIFPEIKCKCGFAGKVSDFKVTHEMAHLGNFEMHCPKCKSHDFEIDKGNEVLILALEFK